MANNFTSSLFAVVASKEDWENSRWEDVEQFIGSNAEKYKGLWEKQRANMMSKGKLGWVPNYCWGALLLAGFPWAVARKQYGFAGMAAAFLILINLFAFPPSSAAATAILVAGTVKQMYLQFVVNQLAKIDASGVTGDERNAAIHAAGGLETQNGVVAGVAAMLILVAMVYIF